MRIRGKIHQSWTRTLLASFALVGLAAGMAASAAPAFAAQTPGHACAVAKQKAALRKLQALNRCYRKAPQLGQQQPNPVCVTNAERRFQRDFMMIEASAECVPTTGDADAVEHFVDQCALGISVLLPGICSSAGSPCGGTNPPCCGGLMCIGAIGQSPRCN